MIRKLKIGASVVVLLGIAALLLLQQQIKRLMEENADLRTQLSQMASLQETNGRLAEQLRAVAETSKASQSEVLRLRAQAARSRQLEQDNTQLKTQRPQLEQQLQQQQATVFSSEEPTSMVVSELKISTEILPETDLGPLELQDGVAVHFDLGGGTNCVVTPTALSDGTVATRISSGVTNADGTISELGIARITSRPGQHCSISVGYRMIALAVKLKAQ